MIGAATIDIADLRARNGASLPPMSADDNVVAVSSELSGGARASTSILGDSEPMADRSQQKRYSAIEANEEETYTVEYGKSLMFVCCAVVK